MLKIYSMIGIPFPPVILGFTTSSVQEAIDANVAKASKAM